LLQLVKLPAETIKYREGMGQQCGDSETYQGMANIVIFKLCLKSGPYHRVYVA
jgi:hypothetical protein